MIKIYTLKCPFTDEVKYVGQTKYDLATRLQVHRSSPTNNLMKAWLKSLDNASPIIEELDVVEDSDADYFEMWWLSQCKAWGFSLLNKRIVSPKWFFKDKKTDAPRTPQSEKTTQQAQQSDFDIYLILETEVKNNNMTIREYIEQIVIDCIQNKVKFTSSPKTNTNHGFQPDGSYRMELTEKVFETVKLMARDGESISDTVNRICWEHIEEEEKWGFSPVPDYVKETFPDGMPQYAEN